MAGHRFFSKTWKISSVQVSVFTGQKGRKCLMALSFCKAAHPRQPTAVTLYALRQEIKWSGERQQLLVVTHNKGTGNLSICRTLSGNYTPSTGLLTSSLSESLQYVTRVQRANVSFSDSRSHKKLQGDWNDNGDLTPQGGDRERRTQCALCRRNSLMKIQAAGNWRR